MLNNDKKTSSLSLFYFLLDIVFVFLSLYLAYYIKPSGNFIGIHLTSPSIETFYRVFPVFVFWYTVFFWKIGLYSLQDIIVFNFNSIAKALKAHCLAFACSIISTYFLYEEKYSRMSLILFFLILPLSMVFVRKFLFYIFRSSFLKHIRMRRAIIIGSGENFQKLSEDFLLKKDFFIKIIKSFSLQEISKIKFFLEDNKVDLIFVCPNFQDPFSMKALNNALSLTFAEVFLIPNYGDRLFLKPSISLIDNLPAIVLNNIGIKHYQITIKRIMDVTFSLLFILVFSPIYLLIMLLIKLTSPGPIFYTQQRMGLDGKLFKCIKFRGMYQNAEQSLGPVWAKKNDSRVTPIGKFLRQTSLDELPQFFNVLKGEMSIVGPRPERPFFVDKFKKEIPGYILRHKMKSGITGWAQVNGWRGQTSLEKRIEYDLWYIQNWSLWLDVKIMLLTPIKGFLNPHAY